MRGIITVNKTGGWIIFTKETAALINLRDVQVFLKFKGVSLRQAVETGLKPVSTIAI